MSDAVRIGILGDLDPASRGYKAINDALQHCATKLQNQARFRMDRYALRPRPDARKLLESFDGIWAAPGSPYKSFDGMLKGIEFARRRDWPFLGTCGGFQYALIECARNVLGIKDADTAENNSGSKNIVIYPVACAVPDRKKDAPKLSGLVPEIRLRPGLVLAIVLYPGHGHRRVLLQFRGQSRLRMGGHGGRIPGRGSRRQGEIRAIESPTHRFYIATLFQPQLSSKPGKPHPLVLAFVQAAADWGRKKLDDSVLE